MRNKPMMIIGLEAVNNINRKQLVFSSVNNNQKTESAMKCLTYVENFWFLFNKQLISWKQKMNFLIFYSNFDEGSEV